MDFNEDLRRNEGDAYALFRDDRLQKLYRRLLREMRGVPFEDCGDIMAGLTFLQTVVATALWKHRLAVPDSLETFAREFDRLDVAGEQRRLYTRAQDDDCGASWCGAGGPCQ